MADQIIQPPFQGWRLAKPGEQPAVGEQDLVHEATGKRFIGPSATWPTEQERTASQRVGAWLVETGKKSALPLAFSAIGAALSGPAAPIGGAIGGMGGLLANQALGIEPPSAAPWIDYPAAAAGGALPSIIGGVAKNFPGVEPGLQRLSAQKAEQIATKLRPPVPAGQLFEQLPRDVTVPLRSFAQAAGQLSEQLGATPPAGRLGGLKRLDALATQTIDAFAAKGIPPTVFDNTQKLLGTYAREAKVGQVRQAGGALRDAMLQDLEDAAAKQGSRQAALYRQAADAYKSELAANRVWDYVNPRSARSAAGPAQGFMQTNYDAVARKILRDPDLARWMDSQSVENLANSFMTLQRNTPRIPSALGQGIGGQTFAQRALEGRPVAAAMAGLGGVLGFQHGGLGGAALGTGATVLATEGIARLLATPTGQAIVMGLASKGTPTPVILRTLGQFATQMGAASLRQPAPQSP